MGDKHSKPEPEIMDTDNCVIPDNSFSESLQSQCDDKNDINYNYISNCDYLQRISIGMKCYDLFCRNKIEWEAFIDFCETKYTNLLDDYVHFISVHNSHSISIAKELERVHGITQCEIESCDVVARHYRVTAREAEADDDDEKQTFYKDLFDSIHHHIFHLNQIGLRDDPTDAKEDSEKEEAQDSADDILFDAEFMKLKRRIFITNIDCMFNCSYVTK